MGFVPNWNCCTACAASICARTRSSPPTRPAAWYAFSTAFAVTVRFSVSLSWNGFIIISRNPHFGLPTSTRAP